ncbi:MAG: hypothetical protein WBO55_04200 [Rhizobiaceae bacterium]
MIDQTLVESALARILASQTFERSERARDLLRYVVSEDLAGRGDRLKAFVIAVDVFGKDDQFDPSTDPLVRVHAGRLRELLASYHDGEGAGEPVCIEVPVGSYRPSYAEQVAHPAANRSAIAGDEVASRLASHASDRQEEALASGLREVAGMVRSTDMRQRLASKAMPAHEPEAQVRPAARGVGVAPLVLRHLKLYWLALAIIITMLGYVVFDLLRKPAGDGNDGGQEIAEKVRGAKGAVTAQLLPSLDVSLESGEAGARRLSALLISAAQGFGTVRMVEASSGPAGSEALPSSIDYRLAISDGPRAGSYLVRLINVDTKTILHSGMLGAAEGGLPLDHQVASLLTAALTPGGIIHSDVAKNGNGNMLTTCIQANNAYGRDRSDDHFRAAFDCFNSLAARDVRSPIVYTELAVLLADAPPGRQEADKGSTRQEIERLADLALSVSPGSAYAHRAKSIAASLGEGSEQALRWSKSAFENNPYNLELEAAYGQALVFGAGDFEAAVPLLQRAVDLDARFKPAWVYSLVSGLIMEGEWEQAHKYCGLIAASPASHYLAMRAVVAHTVGNAVESEQLLERLAGMGDAYAMNPAQFYEENDYPEDLAQRLLTGLREAGYEKAR